MLLNCVVGEDSWDFSLDSKENQLVHPKGNQAWIFIGRTDAEAGSPILWHLMWKADSLEKKPWCWERLKVGGEGDDRGWDGWMASTTQWTWIRASSGSWWWTVKPGDAAVSAVTRVWHDWRTDLLEKKPWCWERLKAGADGDDRGCVGWTTSPTWWAWVWVTELIADFKNCVSFWYIAKWFSYTYT